MPFKYYEPAQPADLNPAYEMLFRAAEARRAQHLAIPGQVADALNTFVRSKQTDRELDQRAQSIGDERDYRNRSSARADQELDLEKRRFQSDEDERQRFATALGGVMGGRQPATVGSVPVNRDTAFDPFGTNRGPRLDASSILGGQRGPSAPAGGGDEFDMSQLAGIKPEHVSTIFSMLDRMHDNKRQAQAAQAKAQAAQQDTENYAGLLDRTLAAKHIDKQQYAAFKFRGATPEGRRAAEDELTKIVTAKADEAKSQATWDATRKTAEAQFKTAFGESPEKLGNLARELTVIEAMPLKERGKALQEALTRAQKTETDHGVDLPGIDMNINLRSALKAPGEYAVDQNGNPQLPSDVDGELTGLAQTSLRDNPLFNNQTLALAGVVPGTGKDQQGTTDFVAKAQEAQKALLAVEKLRILNTLGWKPKDTRDPFAGEDAHAAESLTVDQAKAAGWTRDEWADFKTSGKMPQGKQPK